MELTAVIEALLMLKEPCKVQLYSDSAYVINAFNQDWITKWIMNDFKNAKKKPVENMELWKRLINLSNYHQVEWIKVKGHADNPFNNRCDELARQQIEKNSN